MQKIDFHKHIVLLRVSDVDRQRTFLPIEHDRVERGVVVNRPFRVLRISQHLDHLLQRLRDLHLGRPFVSGDGVRQADIIGIDDIVGVGVPVRSSRSADEHSVLRLTPFPPLRARMERPPGRSIGLSPSPSAGGCGPRRRNTGSDGPRRPPDSPRRADSDRRTPDRRRRDLLMSHDERLPVVLVIR